MNSHHREGARARAAIYTRISKDLQLEGLGVARQLKDCLALAARQDWEVVEVFEDNDISASGGKVRPAYDRLKAFMEAGAIDVVVVYSADRLHRNSRELEDWIDLASATGINIHSATNGNIDLSTPDGQTMARVVTEQKFRAGGQPESTGDPTCKGTFTSAITSIGAPFMPPKGLGHRSAQPETSP